MPLSVVSAFSQNSAPACANRGLVMVQSGHTGLLPQIPLNQYFYDVFNFLLSCNGRLGEPKWEQMNSREINRVRWFDILSPATEPGMRDWWKKCYRAGICRRHLPATVFDRSRTAGALTLYALSSAGCGMGSYDQLVSRPRQEQLHCVHDLAAP